MYNCADIVPYGTAFGTGNGVNYEKIGTAR